MKELLAIFLTIFHNFMVRFYQLRKISKKKNNDRLKKNTRGKVCCVCGLRNVVFFVTYSLHLYLSLTSLTYTRFDVFVCCVAARFLDLNMRISNFIFKLIANATS